MNDVLCVIPARGGSKGITKKNLKTINGLPLVAWSIKQAIEADIPKLDIVVSSDDEEILSLAKTWGVVAHLRPDNLCEDLCSTEEAMLDALQVKPDAELVVLLQPTSPIRMRGRIKGCINRFKSGNHDSLVTVTKFYDFCWFQKMIYSGGEPKVIWVSTYDPENRPMRQQLPLESLLNFDNGNVYITKRTFLEKSKCRLGGDICVSPISQVEGIQIDTEEDFEMTEQIIIGNPCDMEVKSWNPVKW